MHILGAGRSAFLEFLRNLTPTVLLTSLAVVLAVQLDFRRFDPSNWVATVAFFCTVLTAILALYANVSAFLDHAFTPTPDIDRALQKLRYRRHRPRKMLGALVALTWRRRPIVFFEVILALVIVFAGWFGAAISALTAAISALRSGMH